MAFTNNEQLNLELINRARLDLEAEATMYGIEVNDGVDPATPLSTQAMQALAPNDILQRAADTHSQWMIDNDSFSHTGFNGSGSYERMVSAGYTFTGSWMSGENLAFSGTTGSVDLTDEIYNHHRSLFLSASHRENMLNQTFREAGVGQQEGLFSQQGTTYNSSLMTENYAASGQRYFITGVVIDDANGNQFYDVGEGKSGWTISGSAQAGGGSTTSASTGGYALEYDTEATEVNVFFYVSEFTRWSITAHPVNGQNVKLDFLMDGSVLSSNSLTLSENDPNSTDVPIDDAALLGAVDGDLTGNSSANTLTGSRGNNVLTGGDGDDTITGGEGADIAVFDVASTEVSGEVFGEGLRISSSQGVDIVYSVETFRFTDGSFTGAQVAALNNYQVQNENDFTIQQLTVGGNDGESFTGTGVNDGIFSKGGNDTIFGMGGNDNIGAADGNDLIDGGDGHDNIGGGLGDDTITGGLGDDTISGGDGTDTAIFEVASTSVVGSPVRNGTKLVSSQGNDILYDIEVFKFSDGTFTKDQVQSFGRSAPTPVPTRETYVVEELTLGDGSDESFTGSDLNDGVFLRGGNDTVYGMGGNDNIGGSDGNDLIYGGDDNDSLGGGRGYDTLYGGQGNDTIGSGEEDDYVEANEGDDVVSGGSGNDTVYGGDGNDVLAGAEGTDQVFGGLGDDNMGGGYGEDTLNAGEGNDTVGAGPQADLIYGEAGDDSLNGNAGNDTILGGSGNDTITGGLNDDVMSGGVGNDVFFFQAFEPNSTDRITDFVRGEDLLQLRGSLAGLNTSLH